MACAAAMSPTSPTHERGRLALENWAEWCLRDSHRVGYPRATPYARLARTRETWDSTDERAEATESQMPVDEQDAERTEAAVQGLQAHRRAVVLAFYLGRSSLARNARRLGLSREVMLRELDAATVEVGARLTASTAGVAYGAGERCLPRKPAGESRAGFRVSGGGDDGAA